MGRQAVENSRDVKISNCRVVLWEGMVYMSVLAEQAALLLFGWETFCVDFVDAVLQELVVCGGHFAAEAGVGEAHGIVC
jgi:hypothetical protein